MFIEGDGNPYRLGMPFTRAAEAHPLLSFFSNYKTPDKKFKNAKAGISGSKTLSLSYRNELKRIP